MRKQYHGLRPLRVQSLAIDAGECVAVSGFDAGAAEVLVNLITGASLPDEGTIEVCGRATRAIADGEDWLTWLDRFGIVSPRAVLLDAATLGQNLAMPLSLQIDPVPPDIAAQVERLADDIGLDRTALDRPVAGLDPATLARAHLARAMALNPALLIMEHPTIGFAAGQSKPFGETVAQVSASRSLATLVISEDADFSRAAAERRLTLHPASGELRSAGRRWRPW